MGYGSVFLLLLIALGLTLYNVRIFIGQARSMTRTNIIIANLENISGNLKDAETSIRSFLIMKDPTYLVPYKGSRAKIDSVLNLLKTSSETSLSQEKKIEELERNIDARFNVFERSMDVFVSQNFVVTDSLKILIAKGRLTMDSIKRMVEGIQMDEKRMMTKRSSDMSNTSNSIQIIIISSLVVSLLLAFYSIRTYTLENNARLRAVAEADEYRRKLEQQLEQLKTANEELVTLRRDERFASTGRIARTIAHEVRNPLTNINLAVEQLKDDMGPANEDVMPLLEMVVRNSARINQLVTELLNSTRFSELNFQRKSVNTIADEALALAADRIELKHIKVNKHYSQDICDVDVDADKIKIAFLNIIVNAIEAMDEHKGELTIRTASQDGQCTISISDNGHGMDEEALQRLFEPYFTKKPKGNGLGMTNTQNIILNHKGTIGVQSSEQTGTTFTIALRFP